MLHTAHYACNITKYLELIPQHIPRAQIVIAVNIDTPNFRLYIADRKIIVLILLIGTKMLSGLLYLSLFLYITDNY